MKKLLISTALLTSSLLLTDSSAQTAPSLARFIPADALITLEVADLPGAQARLGQSFKDLSSIDLFQLAGAEWPPELRKIGFSSPLDLISREGIISLHLNAKTLEPQVLAVARPKAGLDTAFASFFNDSLQPKGGKKPTVLREGAYRFVQEGKGSDAGYFGYQNGVAYISNSPVLLRNFLKGVQGTGRGLAASPAYASAMNSVGAGTLRAYFNFSAGGDAARSLAALGGSQEGAALAGSLKTLGQFAGSIALRPDGVASTGVLIPNRNGGDAQLYALLTPKGQSFTLASGVPSSATSFQAGQLDLRGLVRYLDGWIVRLGGKGSPTLNQLIQQNASLDLNKDVLSWVGNEYALATFNTGATRPVTASASDPLASLSGSVFYIKVSNEASAKTGFGKLLDASFDLGETLGGMTGTGSSSAGKPKKATKTVNGTVVTSYVQSGSGVWYAVKNGALILTLSDADMTRALSSGARLSDSAGYKATVGKFPASVNSISYSAVPQPQSRANIRNQVELALIGSSDLTVAQKNKLLNSLTDFVDNFQRRLGAGNGYSTIENGRVVTRSFQAVKWN